MPKDDDSATILIFFEPLASTILSGTDKMAQIAGTVMLNDLIAHLGKKKFNNTLELMSNKIINLIVNSKCDSPQLFEALHNLINVVRFDCVVGNLKEIYDKFINVLNSNAHFLVSLRCFTFLYRQRLHVVILSSLSAQIFCPYLMYFLVIFKQVL